MIKSLLLIISAIMMAFAGKFDYRISAGYLYDSNIGQNITEEGKGYFVPEASLKFRGEKVPLFIKVASTYENYITERSPVLNSPFLAFSAGGDWGNKTFKYGTEFRASLYFGQSSQERSDGSDKPVFWAPAKNSYRWYNDFKWKVNRHRFMFNSQMQINDYAETDQDGFRLSLEPSYQYRFSIKKSDNIKFRYLELLPEFEGNYVNSSIYSYTYLAIGAGTNLKLWKTSLYMSLSYASKEFHGEMKHPHTGELIKAKNNYFYSYGSFTIPIVSDLSLKINGKLRFKSSSNPSFDWNRHTIGAKLVWYSTMGKHMRKNSDSKKQNN